ncbi:von Willebrand factor A domain-containing protein 5A-like [Erpetoichthys calabaricus]|uniref:von Willebrand factor A domain-containing protein 5A-like n=1 Tax=Erpetoichthys calabaricus TaxID=27687 RepID=UPI0022348166|nr:von Willebrand factor A domain-containing protein 5A-like [Erpetoichthys calabaricus]
MKLLIQSLPLGCYFNIYLFGSVFVRFFHESVENNKKMMDLAIKNLIKVEKYNGGSEILPALRDIYKKTCRPGYPRQLFIFTDGEVEDTKSVIDEVKKNAATHRCFTFGIGEGASTALVKGIAEASSGHFQFILGEDSLQSKAMQSLEFALQPAVTQIVLRWDVPAGVEVVPVSEAPVTLFHNQRSVFYAQLKGKFEDDAVGCVSLQYNICDEQITTKINFKLQPEDNCRLMAHRLAGKSLITHLEAEDRLNHNNKNEQRIISISTEAGVISAYTAFVTVRKDSNVAVQGPMISILIPGAHFQRSIWDERDICHCSQPAKPKDPGTTLYFTNDILDEMEQTQSCDLTSNADSNNKQVETGQRNSITSSSGVVGRMQLSQRKQGRNLKYTQVGEYRGHGSGWVACSVVRSGTGQALLPPREQEPLILHRENVEETHQHGLVLGGKTKRAYYVLSEERTGPPVGTTVLETKGLTPEQQPVPMSLGRGVGRSHRSMGECLVIEGTNPSRAVSTPCILPGERDTEDSEEDGELPGPSHIDTSSTRASTSRDDSPPLESSQIMGHSQPLEEFVYSGHRIGIELGDLIEMPKVVTESPQAVRLRYENERTGPEAIAFFDDVHIQHTL